jgi:glycosyltransferase involved in cell wall biosynthesis
MKILHVTKKYPDALGGDAVVVANLQKQQIKAGHTVAIVTSNCAEIKQGEHIYKCGLRDTPAMLDAITAKRIISLCMLFFRMFAILKKERPDIIHTHSIDMAFVVSFAARWNNIPLIHTFHIVTFYDRTQSVLRRKSEMWLAKKAKLHRITAPNKYDVKKLHAAGLKQTALLSNGIDLDIWKPYGHIKKNKRITFIAVGRLENQKGYKYLIRAAASLDNSMPVNIVIVGEGSQKQALYELAQSLKVDKNVTFAGQKKSEEVRVLLAKSHVAVFPSLYETTPLTLLEAWAAGVPAIATPVGILRGIKPNFKAVHIVPKKDDQALAAAMRRYASSQSLREMAALAGQKEVKKYTWPRIAGALEAVYRSAQ